MALLPGLAAGRGWYHCRVSWTGVTVSLLGPLGGGRTAGDPVGVLLVSGLVILRLFPCLRDRFSGVWMVRLPVGMRWGCGRCSVNGVVGRSGSVFGSGVCGGWACSSPGVVGSPPGVVGPPGWWAPPPGGLRRGLAGGAIVSAPLGCGGVSLAAGPRDCCTVVSRSAPLGLSGGFPGGLVPVPGPRSDGLRSDGFRVPRSSTASRRRCCFTPLLLASPS